MTMIQGVKKNMKSSLPFGWHWIEMWLVWGFAQWAGEQEKLLAKQGNIIAPDGQAGVFRVLL